MDWTWGWTAVAAIATCVLAAGIGVAAWQIIEARRSRNAQLAAQLYRSFRTKKAKKMLFQIYCADPSNPEATVDKEEIERILDNVSLIGLLVARGIFDETLAIRIFKPWAIRCWSRLGSYVKRIRDERGGYYAKPLEDFAKRCVKYQIEHDAKDDWICLNIGGKKENLVEDFKDKLLSKRELGIAKFKRTLRSVWNHSLREKI